MARIPQGFIDDLLDRLDIVDVVGARIDLRKTGKNYSARCPFHNEKTPSFSVSPDKQFFYCFGCGAGGNAIGFVMDHDHLSFPEAVENLARHCGMEVPREANRDSAIDTYRRKLYKVMEDADRFYRTQLRQHGDKDIAIKYLKKRGLSGTISSTFGIGFAPQGWDNLITHLCQHDDDIKTLIDAGLIVQKEDGRKKTYDRFRNRIIFPIRDTRGRTIGFGGRVLDDSKPKYLNSPETPIFHKGRELYGLYEAHKALGTITSLVVVEGYMDVVALNQHGIHNVVATLGTAATVDHLEKLFRYTSDVIFCFDGDSAGVKAAERALETCLPAMTDGRTARFLFLPDGEDPDTLVRKLGKDSFNQMLDNAQPLSDFLFSHLEEGINLATLDGKARLSQLAAPMVNKLPKGVFQNLMLRELAKRTDMDVEELTAIIAQPEEETEAAIDHDHQEIDHAPPTIEDANYPTELYEDHYYTDYDYSKGDPFDGQPVEQNIAVNKRRLKLSPVERLILLLLHQTELRTEVAAIENLKTLDDPHGEILADLCALLNEYPNYSLNHVLSYYGQERREVLARIVAADMLGVKTENPRDNIAECRDICRHLQEIIGENAPATEKLDQLLHRSLLTDKDQKRLLQLWTREVPEADRTPERYSLVKQALAGKNSHKNKI